MLGQIEVMMANRPTIQRGVTATAGNVTISEVDPESTIVISNSKGSAGYVAARGNVNFNSSTRFKGTVNELYGPVPYELQVGISGGLVKQTTDGLIVYLEGSPSITGGTTDLTTKQYSAKLVDSTTIYCDGPVEWQVISY